MAKYPVKTIKSETCFASEVQMHDGEILIRFRKSGKIYRFSKTLWIDGLKTQANALSDVSLAPARKEILAAANKAIEENRNDNKFVVKLRDVRVSVLRREEPDDDAAMLDRVWTTFISNYEYEFSNPNFKWDDGHAAVFEREMLSPMNWNFIKLDPSDATVCVKANTGIEGFEQAYFTTDHDTSNDIENWFLAICPIAWFGQAVADFD